MIRDKTALLPLCAFLAAGALNVFAGPVGHAQGVQSQAQQQVSDDDLESFANALEKVQEVDAKYKGQILQTKDSQARNSLQQKEEQEMVGAIRDEGLTVNQYKQVADAVQHDSGLWDRLQEKLKK